MNINGLYDAILFDFDGVIMDTEPIHFDCWKEVLRPFRIDMDWERDYSAIVGVADRVMIEYFAARAEPPVDAARLWECYASKNRLFVERLIKDPPVPSATRRLLQSLYVKLPLAIVSSSGKTEIMALLEAACLTQYFKTIICREDVERPKPDSEPYRKAAAMLGASNPLVVEDSIAGIESGTAAGFDVLWVASPEEVAEAVTEKLNNALAQ